MPNLSDSNPSNPEKQPDPALDEEQMRRDFLRGREFTLADVIAQEGGSFMKGESPIPKLVQLKLEINTFINRNLPDVSGALQTVLYRWVDEDIARISKHFNAPLQALLGLLEAIVNNPSMLHELVRQVDMLWGEMNDERPYFQRPGQDPHPEDEYTHESVYQQLVELIDCLKTELKTE
jgi:hypothetical protein